jgi:uncharacterized protein
MIVDAHTHLFDQYVTQKGLGLEEFVNGIRQAGINKALMFGLEQSFFGPSQPANNAITAAARCYPGLLYPVCTIHPREGQQAIAEMERCAAELDMVALKLHPWLQAFAVAENGLIPVLESAARLDWPVIFHDGTPPYCTPLQIAYLAGRVPEATVILGHSGLSDFPLEALAAAKRNPNIYLCMCGVPLIWMRRFLAELGPHRLIYGSDYPFGGPASLKYYRMKIDGMGLAPADHSLVMGGNLLRLIPALNR